MTFVCTTELLEKLSPTEFITNCEYSLLKEMVYIQASITE